MKLKKADYQINFFLSFNFFQNTVGLWRYQIKVICSESFPYRGGEKSVTSFCVSKNPAQPAPRWSIEADTSAFLLKLIIFPKSERTV